MTRCQSLILWLDSHEAHGTPGHVATQQGQVWGAVCLLWMLTRPRCLGP